MAKEDELHTSLAHIILCCVASKGLSRASGKSFTHPGMHGNFLIHGIIGFLHYQSGTFNSDFTDLYRISRKASKYLAIPCLMADLYHSDQTLSSIHLLSGVVPFLLAVTKNENEPLGHLLVACNVASLCYYSHEKKSEWGWYTAGAAVLAYFVTTQMVPSYEKISYPLALAFMEYCATKIPHVSFSPAVTLSPDQTLSSIHLLSGVVPFLLAVTKNENEPLGHLLVACNVASLCYYSHEKKSEWGWYTAGAAVLAYFVTTQMVPSYEKISYPLALAFMEYCATKIPHVSFSPAVTLSP